MRKDKLAPEKMIPHRKPIRMVESVEVLSEKSCRCPLLELPLDWLGYDPEKGLPSYWAVEWMTQASALGLACFSRWRSGSRRAPGIDSFAGSRGFFHSASGKLGD